MYYFLIRSVYCGGNNTFKGLFVGGKNSDKGKHLHGKERKNAHYLNTRTINWSITVNVQVYFIDS